MLFDKNYNFLDVAYAQLKGTSLYYLSQTYKVKEAGYAYLYVSNENATIVDVYFDDVTMSYTPSNIIQSNEYYAHSMLTANSWTRDNNSNNFLGNGGTELNTTSALYDLQYRNYDAVLGRFHQVDPMADRFSSHSPYNFAFNNPILLNDPKGDYPPSVTFEYTVYSNWDGGVGRYYNKYYGGEGGGSSNSGGGGGGRTNSGDYGGRYTNNNGNWTYTPFTSDDEAFAAGAAYNFQHNSWGNTAYGSYEGSMVAYYALTRYGVFLAPSQVKGAIKIVQAKANSRIGAVFLASNGDYLGLMEGGDLRKEFYDLVSAKNYNAALNLVINAYSLDAKVKGSYSLTFTDSRDIILTTAGALGKAQTIDISTGALNFTSFETMIHLVNHEFIHVDQRANLMMEDHNEREFLAYYNNLFSYPSLPNVTQYIIDNDTSKAIIYYNRMSAEQQANYTYPYSNLNH